MSRLASSKTAQIWAERFVWGERSNAPVALLTQGGASLCPGLSPFAPLGRTDREQARGQREQPNSRKTLVRSSEDIQGSRCMSLHPKRGDCPRVFLIQSGGVFGLVNATWGALSCTKPHF